MLEKEKMDFAELSDNELDNVVGGVKYAVYSKETAVNPSTGKECRQVMTFSFDGDANAVMGLLQGKGASALSACGSFKSSFIAPDEGTLNKWIGFQKKRGAITIGN